MVEIHAVVFPCKNVLLLDHPQPKRRRKWIVQDSTGKQWPVFPGKCETCSKKRVVETIRTNEAGTIIGRGSILVCWGTAGDVEASAEIRKELENGEPANG